MHNFDQDPFSISKIYQESKSALSGVGYTIRDGKVRPRLRVALGLFFIYAFAFSIACISHASLWAFAGLLIAFIASVYIVVKRE